MPRGTVRSLLLAFHLLFAMPFSASAEIVSVPSGDPDMDAAIKKARATLTRFWDRLANPKAGDSDFGLKIRFETSVKGQYEHIWVNDVVRTGGTVVAKINNEPDDIPNVKNRQSVSVEEANITDWMYLNSGKYYGAFTVRALLPKMPKEQAESLRAKLAPE